MTATTTNASPSLAEHMHRARFWLVENHTMHIEGGAALACRAPSDAEIDTAVQRFRREGYVAFDALLPADAAARLADAQLRLVARGWPAVFAFVYDEHWQVLHGLTRFFAAALGEPYRVLPDFWAWVVDPAQEQAGWRPHRDRPGAVRPDGTSASLTLWLALTEATPLNGCIYVLPADRDPEYGAGATAVVPRERLQDVRALPAAPGDAFVWSHELLHWGARSSARATGPRASLAWELERGDAPARGPTLVPGALPTLAQRLQLIALQILKYQHMYALPEEVRALARDLRTYA